MRLWKVKSTYRMECYRGLVGVEVKRTGPNDISVWIGLDFKQKINPDLNEGTHSFDELLPERTGRFIPMNALEPARQEVAKLFL